MAALALIIPALVVLHIFGLLPMLCFYAGCFLAIVLDYFDI